MSRRPDIVRQLLRALNASAAVHGCDPLLDHQGETAWATATFVGARHRVVATAEATALSAWLATLPEADLPLHRHFVASCAAEMTGITAIIELLVLEE